MNTPTHWLVTASIARIARLKDKGLAFSSLIWGSVAPDIALYLMSVGAAVWFPLTRGWTMSQSLDYAFDYLFFHNTWWIVMHNLLQAPVVLVAGIALSLVMQKVPRWFRRSRWMLGFFLSCTLHTIIDIATHTTDGPLLLFPFNLTVRFRSPISYWDPNYYGNIFVIFELLLAIGCSVYLVARRVQLKKRKVNEQPLG